MRNKDIEKWEKRRAAKKIPKKLHYLHFFRKHGKNKRYGQ